MTHDTATVAEEEYLQTIMWLQEAGLKVTGANIARAMQVSQPTVSEMVGRLTSDGFIERGSDRTITFTADGRTQAETIVRRHRLIERFLTDILDIPWDEVHEEAERLEYRVTPLVEEKMLRAIGDATTCPHGHPIEVGKREPSALLADCELGAEVCILRFENEAEELLHYLKAAGLEPGMRATVVESGPDGVVIDAREEGRHEVSFSVAETVSVEADPSPAPRAALPEQLELSRDRFGR